MVRSAAEQTISITTAAGLLKRFSCSRSAPPVVRPAHVRAVALSQILELLPLALVVSRYVPVLDRQLVFNEHLRGLYAASATHT